MPKLKKAAKSSAKKPYVHKHSDGSVWAKGFIKGGKMEGLWKWYRKDGSIMRTGHFEKGMQVGAWTTFDRKGRMVKKTMMKDCPNEIDLRDHRRV